MNTKQNFKVALFFLWKILGYLQILVWLIHTKVQVRIKEYQTLPFFDGIFATANKATLKFCLACSCEGTGPSEKPVLSDGIFKEFAVPPTQLLLANSLKF
jgi:hypothetical protein